MELDDVIAKLAGMPEKERKAIEKHALEATKDLIFIPSPGPQSEAYFSEADVLLYGGSPGGGKLLDSQTLTPVPLCTDSRGYKKHGEIEPGDFVYGKKGEMARVVERHPFVDDAKSYEITFSTGEKIKACADHLWETWSRDERLCMLKSTPEWREARKAKRPSRAKEVSKKPWVSSSIAAINSARVHDIAQPAPSVRTTQELYETQRIGKEQRVNHSVAVIKPVLGVDVSLPWDPYLFGLWLGDGYTAAPKIIMMEKDWEGIHGCTPTPLREWAEHTEKNRIQKVLIRSFTELKGVTRLGKKHIPPEYLRASYDQRLELLRGMMDTDGTVDARGHCELGFSNEQLSLDALDIINSLGMKAAIRAKKMESEKHATHYRMKFMPEVPVFKLPRKLAMQKIPTRGTTDFRYIEKIEPCEPVRMNCLTVEGGLYAVGREYIITHNTALEVGLALNCHKRSLIVRRNFVDLAGVLHTLDNILGKENSAVGGTRPVYRNPEGGIIDFMGLGESIDGKQGNPHSLICVDEAAQVPEKQVRMLMGWLRTDIPGQRCQMVLGSNPPLNSTGDWLIDFFAPWLDPQHPNPAKEGELRYYLPNEDGEGDRECGKDEFIEMHGVKVKPQSRTFISSKFTDNPYYDAEQYAKSLAGLPDEARRALISGNFLTNRSDDIYQAIPTSWLRAAQERWQSTPPVGVPMCAMGVDVAQGGADNTVIAIRHDGWYAPLITKPGKETPDGKVVAGLVVQYRRDNAKVIIDQGGGWGGDALGHLKANQVDAIGYMGVKASLKRTVDRQLKFFNTRAEAYWRFRESLDPSQDGGSPIMLPPDPVLIADLCAPIYEIGPNGIKLESKEKVCDRIGRSPDKGDAVVMAWWDGLKQANVQDGWKGLANKKPQVVMGRKARR